MTSSDEENKEWCEQNVENNKITLKLEKSTIYLFTNQLYFKINIFLTNEKKIQFKDFHSRFSWIRQNNKLCFYMWGKSLNRNESAFSNQ